MSISSVALNSSMRANLASLQDTANMMATTQQRLSTGNKVNSAVDNPANFFAARAATTRAGMLDGLKDNISQAIQVVKSADNGIKGITSVIESLRGIVTQARSAINDSVNSGTILGGATGTDGLTKQYNNLIGQLNNLASDSSYNGVNFLTSGGASLTVNLNENATTSITLQGFNAGASGLSISGGGTTLTVAGTSGNLTSGGLSTATNLDNIEKSLNAAIATLQTEASNLASNLSTLTTRQTFISDMVTTLNMGATNLTAADTNLESANMLALQTRNQLGTTALSMSNQASQAILRLF